MRSAPAVEPRVGLMRVTLGAVMLTVAVAPLDTPVLEAVMVAAPLPAAVTRPVALTVATAVLLELYEVDALLVTSCVAPSDMFAVTASCWVAPTEFSVKVEGATVSAVGNGPETAVPVTRA